MKKQETNDIVQYLLPTLEKVGIFKKLCKVDVATDKSGRQRGDVWVSRVEQASKNFEKNIVALIEAKHKNCEIGDIDWRDAMVQGRAKSEAQNLNYYIVSNCTIANRFYNRFNDNEITLDGKVITQLQPVEILEKIQAQVNTDSSHVVHRATINTIPASESKLRKSLQKLADIYRSCGLKKGDDRIDPTVGFVILKYIGEKEKERRTLNRVVKIWDDYGKEKGNYRADFDQSRRDIFRGDYGDAYKDFKELVNFSDKLKNEHYKQIYEEINQFHFHGCNFDVFGSIYEEFASQTKKKEFGEFYTRRHITGLAARLLLRNEVTPRNLKICDPACGTGGFLTEAYKALVNNYTRHGKMNAVIQRNLSNNTFWGFDNDEKSVARTKLNMFLAGDGHTHIYCVDDSLGDWNNEAGWKDSDFDYIITNPPMGQYEGDAAIEKFNFTNEKRYEMLFTEKIIAATKYGQEISIVVPDGMLEATSRENFRKNLLNHCDIYAVISFPKFAFAPYTKEKTYLLFMRKKQEEQINERQEFPIWHFIVDYDGFANSDKRFKTKWHDDLPELEDKFDDALKLSSKYTSDKSYFESNRNNYERSVNRRETEEGLWGKKYGFVEIERINDSNFNNLLTEFYLRPPLFANIAESEFDTKIVELLKTTVLVPQDIDNSKPIHSTIIKSYAINDMFDYFPGNHGLTEEIIYEQQPTNEDESIPIFSGSQDNEIPIGYIKKNAYNKDGKKISYFDGPCLILTKDGSAGLLTYKNQNQIFTINHHACVLKLKANWKDRLHLKWFAHQYQNRLFQVVTSKSDNKVFSTEWFERLKFEIPDDYKEQERLWKKTEAMISLRDKIKVIDNEIGKILSQSVKLLK